MSVNLRRRSDRRPVLWRVLPGITPYGEAMAAMHAHADAMLAGKGREAVWLVEHPPGINPGADARLADLPPLLTLAAAGLPIEAAVGPARAGDWTFHGPGVRGAIVMLDLAERGKDLAGFVDALHRWLAAAAADLGIAGAGRAPFDAAGLWVGDDKLAAIGLRLTRWVTRYGFGLNVAPDLAVMAASGVKPCGIAGKGMTSLAKLRHAAPPLDLVDAALRRRFEAIFGYTSAVDG